MMRKIWIIGLIFCAILIVTTSVASAQTLTQKERAKLEQELAQVEAEQKAAEKELLNAQNQSASIERDIKVLDAKIKAAQLNIKAKTLLIQTLGNDITKKVKYIGTLEQRIERGKDTLEQLMRKTNEVGSYTMPEVLLAQTSITGFFEDIDNFQEVQQGIYDTFEQIRSDKQETETEKNVLDKRRNSEVDARATIEREKKNIEANEAEKQKLLAASKSSEKSYATILAEKKARAAQIRATLFPLAGGGEPIPFGDAYRYALAAQQKTGVRAAFILGIFAQESSLDTDATFGKHIGSCYMTDPATGNGKGANTGSEQKRVMKPDRDVPPYLEITKQLGRDPFSTRVSCWQPNYDSAGNPFGWGGAMGPAQFIASTWMGIKDSLATALGISGMPDPWNPAHAFMAAAMHLRDIGAGTGTYTAERTAACRYYGGGSVCTSVTSVYGNSVMTKADNIQRNMIDPLQGL
jgi:peptidoglycan hydrolase CwlO-like protein